MSDRKPIHYKPSAKSVAEFHKNQGTKAPKWKLPELATHLGTTATNLRALMAHHKGPEASMQVGKSQHRYYDKDVFLAWYASLPKEVRK